VRRILFNGSNRLKKTSKSHLGGNCRSREIKTKVPDSDNNDRIVGLWREFCIVLTGCVPREVECAF